MKNKTGKQKKENKNKSKTPTIYYNSFAKAICV
jgi:hypothetical protein